MVNYEELPLFPLQVVLYPEMPLPLHIFEPRYREMVRYCRAANSPFGVVLIQDAEEPSHNAVGTTARITHYEELADGRMNILVTGETRFRVRETQHDRAYLTARVEPFREQSADPAQIELPVDTVSELFRDYVRGLFAQTGRSLSTLQLPQEPECLSYAIATFLQIPLSEKQGLLEITATGARLEREIKILEREIEAQASLEGLILGRPVDTKELGRLASRN